jgi:hypothetical protein
MDRGEFLFLLNQKLYLVILIAPPSPLLSLLSIAKDLLLSLLPLPYSGRMQARTILSGLKLEIR